jgi:type IV pilus assembly protein PilN
MRITLNLASKPYVDLRSILKRLRILMLILAVLAVPLWYALRSERGKAAAATARVEAMQNNVRRLQQQQQSYQALMQQPQNAAVLTQADFLNGLFRRKAFSWTATMTDLETVLPTGVQVLSLDPEVAKDGAVSIHLRVSGGRDRAVELVRNLEKSRHFASPRLTGEALAQVGGQSNNPNAALQPVSASIAVNFEIVSGYRPLSPDEEKSENEAARKSHKDSESPAPHTRHGSAMTQPGGGAPMPTKKRGVQ